MGNKTQSPSIPDYNGLIGTQALFNQNLARDQSRLNNPDQTNPYGSRTTSYHPDGTSSINTTLNPELQRNFQAANLLNGQSISASSNLLNNPLNFNNAPTVPGFNPSSAPPIPTFDTSGVAPIQRFNNSNITALPDASESNLNTTRDAVYNQNTGYLDPQFKQSQSDLDVKLANQGVVPGSEAYSREQNNLSLQKQRAYGDARNSAIQAGGAEQSRLFGLGLSSRQQGQQEALDNFSTGLQTHNTGTNDALARFNTGLQAHTTGVNDALATSDAALRARQQAVSENQAQHNSTLNDIQNARGGNNITLPTFQSPTSTTMPGVDYIGTAGLGYNAALGNANAQNASDANFRNGLFGLGNAVLQSGTLNQGGGIYDFLSKQFA